MTETTPPICHLAHPGFHMLGDPAFRLSEGARVPSMVVEIDDHKTVLPLRSLAREFHIAADSPDGKMLDLIEQALDFVVAIKPGDKFPSELSDGAASWQPTMQDRRAAASQTRHKLLRCVAARLGKPEATPNITGWEDDPANRKPLDDAIAAAGPDAAQHLETLCEEMAYIEAMHRTLLRGLGAMTEKLMGNRHAVPAKHQEIVKQVQALARLGIASIMQRFEEIEARTIDVEALLRDLPATITWLHRQRDWLFRTNHAWEPVFTDWAAAPKHFDEFFQMVLERTYGFLAPRFMSFQDWTVRQPSPKKAKIHAKVW
jgi:hypothetical protein